MTEQIKNKIDARNTSINELLKGQKFTSERIKACLWPRLRLKI